MQILYRLTPRALRDLDDIWNYISTDSVEAANRVEAAIFDSCAGLSRHPDMGSKRTEITPLAGPFLGGEPLPKFHPGLPA